MGIMDSIKKGLECSKDKSITLQIKFGNKDIGVGHLATMRQKEGGEVYFNTSDDVLYDIISYSWDGPIYKEVVVINTKTKTEKTKKGKAGKMTTGAVVGTILFPGVGTVVGAAIGAGTKSKENTLGSSNSTQTTSKVEEEGTAILTLRNRNTQKQATITIKCTSNINSQLLCFDIPKENDIITKSNDTMAALNGIKALKELLDLGAITEEEFEAKKKEFL